MATDFNAAAEAFAQARDDLTAAVPSLLGKRVSFEIDNTWSHSVGSTGEGVVDRINRAPRKLLGLTVTVRHDNGGAHMVEPHMVRIIN